MLATGMGNGLFSLALDCDIQVLQDLALNVSVYLDVRHLTVGDTLIEIGVRVSCLMWRRFFLVGRKHPLKR